MLATQSTTVNERLTGSLEEYHKSHGAVVAKIRGPNLKKAVELPDLG